MLCDLSVHDDVDVLCQSAVSDRTEILAAWPRYTTDLVRAAPVLALPCGTQESKSSRRAAVTNWRAKSGDVQETAATINGAPDEKAGPDDVCPALVIDEYIDYLQGRTNLHLGFPGW